MSNEFGRAASLWLRATVSTVALAALLLGATIVAAVSGETVVIEQSLTPVLVEIELGATVTWSNQDGERHRVRSRDGPLEFDSGNLDTGESFTFTFADPGLYPYYDHRDRENEAYFGTIIVSAAGTGTDAPLPDTGEVSIIDRAFQPGTFAIATGGSVEWSNDDGEAHTVTSTNDAFDSGILAGGAMFDQMFAEPGSYPYFCLIHPEMRGTIMVSAPADALPDQAAPSVGSGPADTNGEPDATTSSDALAGPSGAGADPATATDASVSIVDRTFQPDAVEAAAGDTITWSNDDIEGHTVSAVDGSFDSGVMTIGDGFAMTFDAPGMYDYFCAIHPEMAGAVIVAEPATS
jgi:plastocyanin